MKLLELYEALFQYVCRLNRAAKTQSHPEFGRVRQELKALLEEINRSAATDVALLKQVQKLERPMVFFVDNLISTSRLKFASQWENNRLAKEVYNDLAGDERFFVDFLDEDMVDTSAEAAERLAVYYTCLGLGFTGMYLGQPDKIRDYMDKIFPRIRQWMDSDKHTKISDQAYAFTDTRILTEPPSDKILFVVIAFLFLSLSVLVVSYGLYYWASDELKTSIAQIQAAGGKP
jgi:type IV/VI secretion system ImpK/VasF family protein